ncbi:MAG: hypothetical protein R2771_09295 [Saprospiraceae bacterium]
MRDMIGAFNVEIAQVGCQCCHEDWYTGELTDCYDYIGMDCNNLQCDYIFPIYQSKRVNKPADGFILAESAMNAPGMNYPPQFMDGSGHYQMRNDQNTQTAMEAIFDQGLDAKFFKTDKR